jgi:hypothetical protein
MREQKKIDERKCTFKTSNNKRKRPPCVQMFVFLSYGTAEKVLIQKKTRARNDYCFVTMSQKHRRKNSSSAAAKIRKKTRRDHRMDVRCCLSFF